MELLETGKKGETLGKELAVVKGVEGGNPVKDKVSSLLEGREIILSEIDWKNVIKSISVENFTLLITKIGEAARLNPDIYRNMGELITAIEIFNTESGFANNKEECELRIRTIESFSFVDWCDSENKDTKSLNRKDLLSYFEVILDMTEEERSNQGMHKVGINDSGSNINLWPLTHELALKMHSKISQEYFCHLPGLSGNTAEQVAKALDQMTNPKGFIELLTGEVWKNIPEEFLKAFIIIPEVEKSEKSEESGISIRTKAIRDISMILKRE